MTLQCYIKDWTLNKEAWRRECEKKDAIKVIKKIVRHFKIVMYQQPSFNFISRGHAYNWSRRIGLPSKDISLGMINHELAHLYAYQRYKCTGHNKAFMRALKIVNRYLVKKNWFDKFITWNFENN